MLADAIKNPYSVNFYGRNNKKTLNADSKIFCPKISDGLKYPNSEILKSYYPNISFSGYIESENRRKCKYAIHGASAVCAGISAAMGEGAAVGADTPFLRGTQALMFFYLKDLLGVDMVSNIEYIARQYTWGQAIGVHGAKAIIGWLGIGGHAVTGGMASAPVTATVRGVNAALSGAITEKMGWGYVHSVEKNTMTPMKQLFADALYFAGMEFIGWSQGEHGVLDPNNITDIKTAMDNLPPEHVSILGNVMNEVSKYFNVQRAGIMFLTSLVHGVITTDPKLDEKSKKERYKAFIAAMLLNTTVYSILDIADSKNISQETIDTVRDLGAKIKATPEVYSEFVRAQQDLYDSLNVEQMDSGDFIKQFKDKQFTYNIAVMSGELSSMLADSWRKRNFAKLRDLSRQINTEGNRVSGHSRIINNRLTKEDRLKMDNDVRLIIEQAKEELRSKNISNHALGRIAGYDGLKVFLNTAYCDPVKNKVGEVPSTILFYGPSGLGKTELGRALAEDTGARFRKENIGLKPDRKVLSKIKEYLNENEEASRTTGRYGIIQLNEIDGFLSDDKTLNDEFTEIIKDCVQKYHTTIFITTNNPLKINDKILNNIGLKIAVNPPDKDDVKSIIRHYASGKEIKDFNLEEIAKLLNEGNSGCSYSNAQIKNIIENLPKDCTQSDLVNIIKALKPVITKDVKDKFENEKNLLAQKEGIC